MYFWKGYSQVCFVLVCDQLESVVAFGIGIEIQKIVLEIENT